MNEQKVWELYRVALKRLKGFQINSIDAQGIAMDAAIEASSKKCDNQEAMVNEIARRLALWFIRDNGLVMNENAEKGYEIENEICERLDEEKRRDSKPIPAQVMLEMHDAGYTWQEIGDICGYTKQGVHKKCS